MKVKLTASKDAYVLVAHLLNKVYDLPVSSIERENVYKSIAMDLSDKFEAKSRVIKKSTSLLTFKKKADITLKYHEAWALEQVLHDILRETTLDTYQNSLLNAFLNHLNQKLA